MTYRGLSVASLRSPSSGASPSAPPTGSSTGAPVPPSASGTGSVTGTPSSTAEATATRSGTRTPSPSAPVCRGMPAVRPLSGSSGTAPALATAAAGAPGMYTAGSCAAGYKTFFPGARLVYALDLGAATPLGGTLTLTTCGHSANNTVLYVGTGCPSWAQPFGCLAGSDNAPACAANPLASTVALVVTQSNYFIQLGGVNGAEVVSGLGWAYAAPAPTLSRSGSGSRSRTRSRSGSRTRSASGTRSRSRKPK